MNATPAARELTPAEVNIINLITQGLTNSKIAEHLTVSRRTVDSHVQNIYAKTGVRSRIKLAAVWAQIQREVSTVDGEISARVPAPTPVRISVDLTPNLYRQLTGWVMGTAVDIDVARLSIADTIRAMIEVTAHNEVMSREVQAAAARLAKS